jgi:hypothetical protein
MAYPCNPDNAGFHSPPSSDRTRIQKRRFASNFAQTLSMVSGFAFASSALYRPRPAAGAHSLACGNTRLLPGRGGVTINPESFRGCARMAVLQPRAGQNRLARNRCISSRIFSRTSNNSARKESSRSGGSKFFCATLSAAAMLVCR